MQVCDTGGVQSVSKGRAPGKWTQSIVLYELVTFELYMLMELSILYILKLCTDCDIVLLRTIATLKE